MATTVVPRRKQDKVAHTILRRVIFERVVPLSIRSDRQCSWAHERSNAKNLLISQHQKSVSGGHNPRGNAICERANQTLGKMIRKLTDKEYSTLKERERARSLNLRFTFTINLFKTILIGPKLPSFLFYYVWTEDIFLLSDLPVFFNTERHLKVVTSTSMRWPVCQCLLG